MVLKFCEVFNQACDKMGRCGTPGQHLKGWVEGAGFTNVQHKVYKVPIGPWAKEKKMVSAIAVLPDVLQWAGAHHRLDLSCC